MWDYKVSKSASSWRSHVGYWLSLNHTSLLVVKYENLFTNLYAELKRITEFIKFPYTEDALNCSVNYFVKQHFHRRHFRNQYDYTLKQKALINKQIELANIILQSFAIKYEEI